MLNNHKQFWDNFCFYLLFLILSIFYLYLYFLSSNEILGDKWAYNNLFINYSSGFVRRGLLGEIFIIFNEIYNLQPLEFFPKIFFVLYIFQLLIFLKLIHKFKKYNLFIFFLVLNPTLLLFYIYEINVFMAKDIFINLSILIHAYIITNKSTNYTNYKKILVFVIFPILTLNIFIHENQIIFLPFHILSHS